MLSCEEGREAAVALFSALYITGSTKTLFELLKTIPGPDPYRRMFLAILLFERGDYAMAARQIAGTIKKMTNEAPASFIFASLMLAAEAELTAAVSMGGAGAVRAEGGLEGLEAFNGGARPVHAPGQDQDPCRRAGRRLSDSKA